MTLNVKTLARILAVISAILFGAFAILLYKTGGQAPAQPAHDGLKELLAMLAFLGINAFTLAYLSLNRK
jgi:hypothetical protein